MELWVRSNILRVALSFDDNYDHFFIVFKNLKMGKLAISEKFYSIQGGPGRMHQLR